MGNNRRDQRGSGGQTLGQLVMFPVALLLLFGAVQMGLWYSGNQAASAAALACATSQRVTQPLPGQSRADAVAVIGSRLTNPTITITDNGVTVTCTVTGQVSRVIDLGLAPVTQQVTLPKERLS